MGMMSVFVGAMVGGCFGVIITSLAVAAKRADEQNGVYEIEKRCVPEPAPPVSGERIIRFTDPNGVLLFTIPDGERVAGICHYLDQDHAEINGMRWQMTEFALQMQIRGILFSPSMIE